MLRLAETAGEPEREVVASCRLLRFYLECGRAHRALRLIPGLERMIQALDRPEPHLAVLGELQSDLMFARGQFDEAEEIARESLACCWGDRGGVRQRCRLLSCVGRVQLGTGRHVLAEETFTEVLELARSIGDRRIEAGALNALGEVAGRSTRYQEAVDRFKAALAIDHDLGDRYATGTKLANLGIAYAAIGLYRRAERFLRKALELHEAIGHPGLLNDVMVSLGEVVAQLGDHESARSLLGDAARVAVQRGDTRTELRARVKLAAVLAGSSEPAQIEEAETLARAVLETGRKLGLRSSCARALHVLSLVAAGRGDRAAAIANEQEAIALVHAGAAPVDGVLSIHHLGQLLLADGRAAQATERLREAASLVQRRLDDLRDPDLRDGYQRQEAVRRVLIDAARLSPEA
jgi:tetratricopeptide (TPR) repeat protein